MSATLCWASLTYEAFEALIAMVEVTPPSPKETVQPDSAVSSSDQPRAEKTIYRTTRHTTS